MIQLERAIEKKKNNWKNITKEKIKENIKKLERKKYTN
jgi:hypothetical protein